MDMELEIKKYDRSSRKRERSSQKIEFGNSSATSSKDIGNLRSIVYDLKERALAKNTRVPISYLDLLFDLEECLKKQDVDQHSLHQLAIKARKEVISLHSIVQEVDTMIKEKNELVQKAIAKFEADEIDRFQNANDAKSFLRKLLEKLTKSESELTAEYLDHAKQNGLPQRTNKLRAFIYETCVDDFRQHGFEFNEEDYKNSSFKNCDASSNNWSAHDYAKISAKLISVLPVLFNQMAAVGVSLFSVYNLISDWNKCYTEPLKEIAKSISDDYDVEIKRGFMLASLIDFYGLAADADSMASILEDYVLSL